MCTICLQQLCLPLSLGMLMLLVTLGGVAYPQVTPPITSSGLNTQVGGPIAIAGKTQFNITGGTRPGGGTNLFHSFGNFNVPTNNIANFLNSGSIGLNGAVLPPNLPTANILGRINGGNPSSIFGMIQTNGPGGFPNANLFLMNPNGFLFGPTATINVGGMVTFTTADYMRLTDNTRFNAVGGPADLLLTAAPVASFGFLGNNPAAIAIQGSTLIVVDGQSLSLVGGNQGFTATDPDTGNPIPVPGGITMTGGKLLAPGGQINIASVAGPGEISAVDFTPTPGMTMGNISLAQGALLDVSGDAAGTAMIRGGQLVIDNATVSADTGNTNGPVAAIDINLKGNLSINADTQPAITARTTGSGDAGGVNIVSANLTATSSTTNFPFALIDTHTSGTGKGGNVTISTGYLQATTSSLPFWFIDSGTQGPGNGGDVNITARNIVMHNTEITTGDSLFRNTPFTESVTGSGGNVTITADSLNMSAATIATDAFGGQGGDIRLTIGDIEMEQGSIVGSVALNGNGGITINGNSLAMDTASIEADTAFAAGKPITITSNAVELINGATIRSHTLGDANASDIIIAAANHITLSDPRPSSIPSGFYSSSVGIEEGSPVGGHSGSVILTTPRLEISGGARIDTSTETSGRGGNVIIKADSVSISGERSFPIIVEDEFNIANSHASGIFSRSVGTQFCSGLCGTGGHVSISTGSLTLTNGGQINSDTASTGRGGDITISATGQVLLSGTMLDGTPSGNYSRAVGQRPDAGAGGNITVTAGQAMTMNNGSTVSASSTGPGNTGNIQINAGNQFTMNNASVTTEANQAGGGAIKITTNPNGTVQLTNSMVSASVLDGNGGGGSVNIDPQFVILQNSQILAQAVQGPGGNISITTNLLLPDSASVISASSQFGQQGNIVIQSPISPASGKIVPLSQKPLIATSLLSQRCAALAGGNISSFTLAGRDTLPAEPGNWFSAPLALTTSGSEGGTVREADNMTSDETPLLSVRKIAPPGFLAQAFAVESSGCQS